MSELNRLLSELTPAQQQKTLAAARIPTPWGFRFARVALALVATLLSATGISWALTAGQGQLAQPADLSQAMPLPTAEKRLAAPLASPTQKVVTAPIGYVARQQQPAPADATVMAKVEAPLARVAAPVPSAPQAPVAEPVAPAQASSLTVESVELTGEQLAAIAYEKAQKRAQVGDNQKAIAHLREAVKYHPEHIDAVNQLAALLFGRNQVRDAESVLRKGIHDNPYSGSLKLTLARMYQQSEREESALNVLSVPVETLDGDATRVVAMRAALAQKLGDNTTAQSSYQWLTAHDPADGRWWLGLAVSNERLGEHQGAQTAYQKALQAGGMSAPSAKFARERLGYLQTLNQGAGHDN